MKVAGTGATGFPGRYFLNELVGRSDTVRCWYRPESDRTGFELLASRINSLPGNLGVVAADGALVAGSQAVVHVAL